MVMSFRSMRLREQRISHQHEPDSDGECAAERARLSTVVVIPKDHGASSASNSLIAYSTCSSAFGSVAARYCRMRGVVAMTFSAR
jgi:hypothetical protein